MVKALDLIEKLNKLENSEDIDEALYFHRNLHKASSKSGAPLSFSKASKEEEKKWGKDTIVSHDVNPKGITVKTHVVAKSKTSPKGFEHHFFDYHTSGEKAGQVKSSTTTHFGSHEDAVAHANKSDLHRMAKKSKEKAVGSVKTKAANFLKAGAHSASKTVLKQLGL